MNLDTWLPKIPKVSLIDLRSVFSIDLRSLVVFRVMLALVILADLALRSADLTVFYTDTGVLPRRDVLSISGSAYWSLHHANGEWWWQALLFVIAAIFALCLLVGYRTRLATVGSFVLLASLMNRNPLLLQGGDQLLAVICFWAMFLPLGARRSIDAAIQPFRRDDPNRLRHAPDDAQPYFSVATIAVIFQVLYLYTFTAFLKTGDAWTSRFDAAYYAVSLQHFATPIGHWFSQFEGMLKLATLFVLFVEFVGPVLVLLPFLWPRLRIIGLLLLASLHVAFGLMLHIGLFPLIDLTSLSLLLPGALWAWLAARRMRTDENGNRIPTRRERIIIHYDEGCTFCLKTCLILRELLLPPRVRIVTAQSDPRIQEILERENSWVVTDADGKTYVHWHAMAFLFRQSPLLKPIGWVMEFPPFMMLGNILYRWTGNNRIAMGAFTSRTLPWVPVRLRPTLAGSILALFFFYIVSAFNVYGMPGLRGKMPKHVDHVARAARIDQRWDMFAPFPLTLSSYPSAPGKLRNGETVELYPLTRSTAEWDPGEHFYPLFEGYRWRKYLGRVDSHKNNVVRRAFGDYLCRSWNGQTRARDTQLATLQVRFIKFRTNTDGLPKERTERMVWRHWCFKEFAPKDV